MDIEAQRRLDAVRVRRSELENSAIDEFVAGRVSRRDFIRYASVIGLSMPVLAVVLEACSTSSNPTTGGNIKKGGRLNVGHQTPAGAMDPILTNDLGRLTILGQCGEYLSFSDKDLKLRPVLATSWTPNADGSAWTFKIRQGVKYNDGTTPMTVEDVVATFNRLADPSITGNNALSNFKGVLSKGNVTKVDSQTVKFQIDVPTSAHQQIHTRTDVASLAYKRIRQAMALSIDRSAIIQGLWNGKAQIANDRPIFKMYPSSDTTVAQRAQDTTKAKDLLAQAGVPNGFSVTLYTEQVQEIPNLAQLLQAAVKAIGVTITLSISDSGTYYDKYWLTSQLGITDYGHRGVPNTFLSAPLVSTGTWNSAHFNNPTYDGLYKNYVKAIDLPAQKAVTGQIEKLLLDETPLIIPYNYDFLTAVKKKVAGVETTGMGHVNFRLAGITS